MNNTQNRYTKVYRRLLKKYLDGTCSPAEQKLVEDWYETYTQERLAVENSHRTGATDETGIRMWSRIELGVQQPKRIPRGTRTWMNIAASVAFLAVATYLLTTVQWTQTPLQTTDPITPGKIAATITLDREGTGVYLDTTLQADALLDLGIDVQYDNGKPFYALTAATEKAFEEYTISTNKGEEIQIMLPDQSKVWINASSKITFDSGFGTNTYRNVHLEGEAYFEVAHDSKRPFRVHAKESTIEVLGTSFNVNAYGADAQTATTLLQGSVRLHRQVLSPGQQAVYDGENMRIGEVDTDDFVAWKNGFFNFNGVGLPKIIAQLENWYNIEFELPQAVSTERIHGMIPKYQDLQSVLNVLEKAGMGTFKIEGRRVKVVN